MVVMFMRYAANPALVFSFILAVSILSLAGALIAEHVFGLAPCILCIYQRIPFVLAIGISIAGFFVMHHSLAGRIIPLLMCALAFAGNTILATHHVGVEQGWWDSFSSGCAVQGITATTTQGILAQIQNAPVVQCDKPAWVDPILGWSMAGYNALLCAGMAVFCIICLYVTLFTSRPQINVDV